MLEEHEMKQENLRIALANGLKLINGQPDPEKVAEIKDLAEKNRLLKQPPPEEELIPISPSKPKTQANPDKQPDKSPDKSPDKLPDSPISPNSPKKGLKSSLSVASIKPPINQLSVVLAEIQQKVESGQMLTPSERAFQHDITMMQRANSIIQDSCIDMKWERYLFEHTKDYHSVEKLYKSYQKSEKEQRDRLLNFLTKRKYLPKNGSIDKASNPIKLHHTRLTLSNKLPKLARVKTLPKLAHAKEIEQIAERQLKTYLSAKAIPTIKDGPLSPMVLV